MSKLTLREVLEPHFSTVKFNKDLAKRVHFFLTGYIGKNHEHIAFFGGNLIGVNTVWFMDSDVTRFFSHVLDIDMLDLEKDLKEAEIVNPNYKVASDMMNQVLMYMIHRFSRSPDMLKQDDRSKAMYDVASIFFVRCLVILISDYFKYPADIEVAQLAYARLSKKFLIKELGTWLKVIDYRAKDLTGPSSIHFKTLHAFDDDTAIIYCINDSQGRIRDLIKNYNREFYNVHGSGEAIALTSATMVDADGEEVLKEKTRSVESIVTYMQQILIDPRSFVRDDFISVIVEINTNTSVKMIRHTLMWMSEQYSQPKNHEEISNFVAQVVIYSQYLIDNQVEPSKRKDYAALLVELKNLYLSTRSTDADLLKLRNDGEKLIKKANHGKSLSDSIISATRTSIILYITLRALTGHSRKS